MRILFLGGSKFQIPPIKHNIVEENIFIKAGDAVKKFDGSHHTLGTMIMKFDSQSEMLEKMDNMERYLKVLVM